MTRHSTRGELVLVAGVTSLAAFGYFSFIAFLGDPRRVDVSTMVARAVAAAVVGIFMTLRERDREVPAFCAAASDGFALAAVAVVTNSLFGSELSGRELAIRTAGLLCGLPLLAAFAQLLVRKRAAPTPTT